MRYQYPLGSNSPPIEILNPRYFDLDIMKFKRYLNQVGRGIMDGWHILRYIQGRVVVSTELLNTLDIVLHTIDLVGY